MSRPSFLNGGKALDDAAYDDTLDCFHRLKVVPYHNWYQIVETRPGRNTRSKLSGHFKRSGIAMWPKPWQNLLASRETELAETFPMYVVCDWIGNSTLVAQKHYLTVTDDHFEQATAVEELQQSVAAFCESGGNNGIEGNTSVVERAKTPQESAPFRSMPQDAGASSGRYRT